MNCAHCGGVMRGSAGLTEGGVHYPLCYPDDGMECYRLVTVYRHPIVECPCVEGVLPNSLLRTSANGYVGSCQTLDQAIDAVQAALAIHQPCHTAESGPWDCRYAHWDPATGIHDEPACCVECDDSCEQPIRYPCATAQALGVAE